MGQRAASKLLNGAQQTESYSKYFRTYEKRGGMAKAEKDFEAISPQDVSEFVLPSTFGKVGVVGDRSVIFKARGVEGKPTIEVVKHETLLRMNIPSDNPKHVSDIITYLD